MQPMLSPDMFAVLVVRQSVMASAFGKFGGLPRAALYPSR
jgi:hypothetical protein